MRDRVNQSVSVLRTTAIGGIFFLFPLIVVGALLGQMGQLVWAVAKAVQDYIPVSSPLGYSLLLVIAVLLILLLCFVSGMVARATLGKRFNAALEKYLLMLFPRYAIFKEQLTGNIGGEVLRNQLSPVLVSMPEGQRIALEVERGLIDDASRVTVFLPGAPDPWNGIVVVVESFRVKPLNIPFTEAMSTLEQLGKGTLKVMSSSSTQLLPPP